MKVAKQMSDEHQDGRTMAHPPVSSGAAAHDAQDWKQVDWKKVTREVNRLQARIVKATKEGRWGRVQALQRLLTHSFSGKALAVRRVTTNRGKRTPGVDQAVWLGSAQKWQAVRQLRRRGYRAQPLRRVYIEKRNSTKKRPLGIPTTKDRAMQALHLLALSPVAETTGDGISFGFRPQRSTHDAIEQCFRLLCRKTSAQWILEGDIKSCFDQISHSWLLDHAPMDKKVLLEWLKAGFMDKSVLHPTDEGTPQGGIASPVLANLALDGLQGMLREMFPKRAGRAAHQVHAVRYADDFIVVADSHAVLETVVKPRLAAFLAPRGLQLSDEKTVITHIDTGCEFLGMNVRKYSNKLLIKPSKQSVHRLLHYLRELIKQHRTAAAGVLIQILNRKIRGWAYYYRHAVSKEVFAYVDHQIWKALWRWARRRHPGKSARWVMDKYFLPREGRQRVFSGHVKNCNGQQQLVRLFHASSIPIVRHVPVKSEANPLDPEWSDYFRKRGSRMRRRATPPNPHSMTARLQLAPEPTTTAFRNPVPERGG